MEGVIGRHAEPAARKSAAGVPSAVFPARRLQIAFLLNSTHCLTSIFNFAGRAFFDESCSEITYCTVLNATRENFHFEVIKK